MSSSAAGGIPPGGVVTGPLSSNHISLLVISGLSPMTALWTRSNLSPDIERTVMDFGTANAPASAQETASSTVFGTGHPSAHRSSHHLLNLRLA